MGGESQADQLGTAQGVMEYNISGLSTNQFEVLQQVGQILSTQSWYLGGGTAVSIYFGHRGSEDLDWFCEGSLSDPHQLAGFLIDQGLDFTLESTSPRTLYGTVKGIRISFFEYQYPLLQPLKKFNEGQCVLASLDDLACMKLAAVAQRGARKDFIDVYALIQHYRPLTVLLECYKKKYKTDNITSVLTGLIYFDDAETQPDPKDWPIKWGEVKKQIRRWVSQYSV